MKLLIMTGPLYPQPGNNANLIGKLIPCFLKAGHEVHLLSAAFGVEESQLPTEYFGVPVHWATDQKKDWKRKRLYPALSRLKKEPGYNGELGAKLIEDAAKALKRRFAYDVIISTMQPYPAALALSRIPNVMRAVYLMDPPDYVFDSLPWERGQKQLQSALTKCDVIFTTPFIQDAVRVKGLEAVWRKTTPVSFPHLTENQMISTEQDILLPRDKINLLFCGALFPDVRSPECFLEILERLDERFCVTIFGRNCQAYWKKHGVETHAQMHVLPPQPYQVALNAMEHADILINLGNNMHVHMPSKVLDYINTGKPIVNFHKFADCPTLYYTRRYPLCLNILEKGFDADRDTDRFLEFCLANRGKRLPRDFLEERYDDCRPETIARVILEQLNCLQ